MLGVVLIYVGVVLILNGVGRLCNVDAKSSAVFNVFTGMLSFILNIVSIETERIVRELTSAYAISVRNSGFLTSL